MILIDIPVKCQIWVDAQVLLEVLGVPVQIVSALAEPIFRY